LKHRLYDTGEARRGNRGGPPLAIGIAKMYLRSGFVRTVVNKGMLLRRIPHVWRPIPHSFEIVPTFPKR